MMRRALFGLALIPFMVCNSVAGEAPAPSSASGSSQEVQTPSPDHEAKKHISTRIQPDRRSAQGAMPLSAAAAYASEHSASLPISSPPKPPPPSTHPWTGFYVGVGAGVGAQP